MRSIEELNSVAVEYDALFPSEVREALVRLNEIDKSIMTGAISEKFFPETELNKMLMEITALHSFFCNKFYKWDAILDNQHADIFMDIKDRAEDPKKFTVAAANKEADRDTREVRYLAKVYEGSVKRCEEYINTLKKLLGKEEREFKRS